MKIPLRLAIILGVLTIFTSGIHLLAPSTPAPEQIGIRLAISAVAVLIASLVGWQFGRSLGKSLEGLTANIERITSGKWNQQVEVTGNDELSRLVEAFNAMALQLKEKRTALELRTAVRTRELEQQSSYLSASAEVSRAVTSILDPNLLIRQVVELIRQSFELYYVGLFLTDEVGEWAILRAGSGEAGRAMLTRGHRIKVGAGMIGWCIANAQARIALEAETDAVRLITPELPLTRSEAALPLRSRGKVIGALTVQSDQPGAFDQARIVVLQIMADQVAVALENARLFAESQQALERTRRAYAELSREAWQQTLQAKPNWGYYCDESGVTPLNGDASASQPIGDELPTLNLPIRLRGQTIGRVLAHKSAMESDWRADEITLMKMLVARLEAALESARLYRDTQERAARERLIGEITGRIRETLDFDTILQTATREMRQALNLAEVEARLGISAVGKDDVRPN